MEDYLGNESFDYRTEFLSPALSKLQNGTMEARQPSWRINMDRYHLPERNMNSHFGFGFLVKTLRRERRLTKYYNRQERVLQGYQEVDSFTELGALPNSLTEEETKKLDKGVRAAIYASNVCNMLLFVAKLFASIESRSLAVIASTLDSLLDILSGFILWFTSYAMNKPNLQQYPIGKNRMQPVGIVVFATVMATLGLQILFESARQIITKAEPDRNEEKERWMVGIMIGVTVVKVVLTYYCRRFKNEIVRAYAQDHFFDVITNSVGLASAVLAIKFFWWLDPLGAILIAVYTMSNWARTVMDNVWSLIGRTAPAEHVAKVTYMIWNHDERIENINTVRAYSFGSNYFVEVDIVLPEQTPLPLAHDIGESLQLKLEKLPEIERAFVHVDLHADHIKLSHNQN
ncbi:hypothetical protein QN277_010208 [Acacia crassicarpa]|uniref:Cation efflux protein cytoplasmic domain-containing protein n=1 Tax=Acacia crassicarpa TaxID=499986 RepID=A0AAE1JI08_9FABA|nr:hypothetical protein QN277_010208 [Acacia crassicarpa]